MEPTFRQDGWIGLAVFAALIAAMWALDAFVSHTAMVALGVAVLVGFLAACIREMGSHRRN